MPSRLDISLNPAYATAIIRPVSPASSIGAEPLNDATDPEDKLLSQADFDKRCWNNLKIDVQTNEELEAESRPVYYGYHMLDPERAGTCYVFDVRIVSQIQLPATLHEQVSKRLREEVRKLHETELFEQVLLRGSQVGLDVQTPTGDIDTIMRNLLQPSGKDLVVPSARDITGPSTMTSQASFYVPEHDMDTSQSTGGKKGKGKRIA
jgi:hypothetical protein